MKKITLSAFLIASLLSFSACNSNKSEDSKEVAEEQNEKKMDDTPMEALEEDSKFAVDAADGGMIEVKLAELAATNASSQVVKDFAKNMVTDHLKANEELKALAQQKNITLPMALSDDKQKDYDDLAKKQGKDFDKAYASYMVDDHDEDVKEFEKAAKDCKDADLKAWAGGKIATLQHHLDMAKKMKDATK